MPTATFRFYEELNDFLGPDRRKREFQVHFRPGSTIGELVGELGVPAEHVDLVLLNGRSEDFCVPVRDGDRVSVYPVFERLNIASVTLLHGRPLRRIKFLAEAGLEELAAAMRSSGLDVRSHTSRSPSELLRRAVEEGRVLLCVDPRVAKEPGLTHALVVRGRDTETQMASIVSQLDLYLPPKPQGSG
jgi:hypothetical protein